MSLSFQSGSLLAAGLSEVGVETLARTVAGYVAAGELPSAQLAIARRGTLGAAFSFGEVASDTPATNDTLYTGFSTTKAVVSAAAWLLIQDGALDVSERVVDIIPEFGNNDKAAVTVEHLLTHTAGFPDAPFAPLDWNDSARRLERFSSWRLDFTPGSKFQYHPGATLWVIAEIIGRRAGVDFREFIRTRIVEPLELSDLYLGLPETLGHRVANVVNVGEAPSDEAMAALGLRIARATADYETYLEAYNRADYRAVGSPGAGAIMNASSLAMFYQGLLRAGKGDDKVWSAETVAMGLRVRTGDLLDPMTRKPANRALGMVIAGDDERIYRSFGQANSASTFGHPGVGGQIGWADPDTGISFAFFTNGCDRNSLRMGLRSIALSTQAALCAV